MGISDVCSPGKYLLLSGQERDIISKILRLDPSGTRKRTDETLMRIGNLHYLLARGLKGLGEWTTPKREYHLKRAKKAFSRVKSNIIAKRNLGLVCLESGDEKRAMKYVDAALKELRKDAELWTAKGILLHRSEKPSESLRCFDRAIKLRDNDPRIWTARGRLLADMSRLEDALDSFNEAIVRDRTFIPAWGEKMDALIRLERKDEAAQVSDVIQDMVSAGDDFEHEGESPEPLEPLELPEPIDSLETEPTLDEPLEDQDENRDRLLDFLLQVDGIGESKAEIIIAQGLNSFDGLRKASLRDLTKVRGISEKIAENIKERIESEPVMEERRRPMPAEIPEEAMETARAHLEEGDYEKAFTDYDSLVELDPEDEDAWFNRGEVLQALGRAREAIESYERVISINDKNVGAWMEKASVLLEIGKPLDAVECYKNVLEKDSENTYHLAERAKMLAEAGNLDAAILCYDIILEKDPENLEANLGMVFSLLQLGDLDRAERCLDAAARLTSVNEKIWWARGHLMDRRGRWGAAIQFYDRAISLRWDYPDPWIGKGEIFIRQGKYEEAKRCFEKVLEMDAGNADAWIGKAKALDSMGLGNRAFEWLNDFLELNPENAEVLEMRDRLRSNSPADHQTLLREARIQREIGDFETAVDIIVKAIKENPDEEDAWTLLGDILLDLADPMKSLSKLETATSTVPISASSLTQKGEILLRLGMCADALKCFDRALSLDENHEKARRLRERCFEETEKAI
ncbi:MAG: tetratricopeptide repeat protein [Thermoplasmata archaeon]